jgi:uncharacterized SAM-binding protein YcdF (DUF218 family)
MVQGCPEKPFILSRRLLLICLSAFLAITFFGLWLQTDSASGFRQELKERLRKKLVSIDQLPPETTADVIYILGGSQKSLKFKFKTAADLYHKAICKKILILSRPGKTEYSSLLGRNLTNNEWANWKFEELGIPKKNVEPISIKKGFFGTLTEAKGISRLIRERGYKSVALITSPYHTHRVKISFEEFLKDNGVTLYVQGSDRGAPLRGLVVEFIKLKIYEFFLVS